MTHRHDTNPALASIRPRSNAETRWAFSCRAVQLREAAATPLPPVGRQRSSVLDQLPVHRFALIWGHDVVLSNRGSRCWDSNDNPDAAFRTPLTRVSGGPQRLTRTRHIPPQRWRLNALTAGGTPRNLVVVGEPQGSPVEKGCVQEPFTKPWDVLAHAPRLSRFTPLAFQCQVGHIKTIHTPLSRFGERGVCIVAMRKAI